MYFYISLGYIVQILPEKISRIFHFYFFLSHNLKGKLMPRDQFVKCFFPLSLLLLPVILLLLTFSTFVFVWHLRQLVKATTMLPDSNQKRHCQGEKNKHQFHRIWEITTWFATKTPRFSCTILPLFPCPATITARKQLGKEESVWTQTKIK